LRISSATVPLAAFAVAAGTGLAWLETVDACFSAILAALALYIAAVDVERLEIPDIANAGIFTAGIAWTFIDSGFDVTACAFAIVRSLIAAGILFVIRAAYSKVRGIEGLGLGDVKLAGAGASWLSSSSMLIALLVAVIAAIVAIIGRSLIRKERIQSQIAVPLGTFLAPAIWLAWFAQVGNAYPPDWAATSFQ
jgi:leader peptidase (prepilin peptidase) / N-methyltransferase